jgi:ribosome-binding protein aMBF1 (putative translation factor)
MKRNYREFSKLKKHLLKDPKVQAEYDCLQPEFALIRAMIEARMKHGLTQAALAKRIGTKQSVISRLESGRANPSVSFLRKLATGLNTNLEIRFISP